MPMEFLVPSLRVTLFTEMMEKGAMENKLNELMELEEDNIIAGLDHQVQKQRQKAWHDRHIKTKEL